MSQEIRKFRDAEPRIESGAIQFGRDWPGVFIRGDEAFSYAQQLELLMEDENINPTVLNDLVELFRSCTVGKDGRVV